MTFGFLFLWPPSENIFSFLWFGLTSILYVKKRAVLTLEFDIFLACFKFAMLFTNFFCNYFSNVWVNFFLRKFSFNLESKNFWNYKWFEARKRLEKTITMMQIGGFGPLNNKKVFFWILGNPCSLYGHSSRIGNISAFSATNFVPYTGGGLYL